MEVLRIKQLSKSYGGTQVLNKIDLRINKGEIVGLVGENGAGKTTLMKCICQLTRSDSGNVFFYEGKKSVGILIEKPSLYGHMTAKENLIFFCKALGVKKNETVVNELIDLVGLSKAVTKSVSEFSLGMKQRLGLAIALLNEPDLLILDEPMNGLDPRGIVAMRELLLSIANEQGTAILISSHILSELEVMVDRVCFLKQGRVVNESSSVELSSQLKSELLITTPQLDIAISQIEKVLGYKPKVIDGTTFSMKKNEIDFEGTLKLLISNNIEILNIATRQDTLEDYYLHIQDQDS